jgi:hypothetical protein
MAVIRRADENNAKMIARPLLTIKSADSGYGLDAVSCSIRPLKGRYCRFNAKSLKGGNCYFLSARFSGLGWGISTIDLLRSGQLPRPKGKTIGLEAYRKMSN